ncbi:DctP family TRAP transporter solute-binding subunit [Bacillus sp. 1P02SD]|uniref:DctP family TRAP transporter solute-binding subunit n=1 Tax=Bacillus sp. 1P02SD TaxID=3132264 RepID=UPI0039A2DC39
MKRKQLLLTMILAMLLIISTACGKSSSSGGAKGEDDVTVLKIASASPSSDLIPKTLLEFADAVEKETDGKVKVEVHADGVLGSEHQTIEQVRSGAIEMQLALAIAIFEVYDSGLAIDELPFAFPTRESAYAAVDGKVGDLLKKGAEKQGFKVLAFWENGYRHFTNNVRPIETVKDLEGIKFRIAESDMRIETFKNLNASATPIALPELYTALQQGTVDGQENPVSLIYNFKFHEVQDYLSLSGHIWNGAPMVMNLDVWNSLKPEYQEIIEKNAIKFQDIQREKNQQLEKDLLKKLEEEGMKINEVDKKEFQEAVQPVWDNAKDRFGEEMLNAINEYRN